MLLIKFLQSYDFMVLNTGFEPVTSSMSWKHSTAELIEHVYLKGRAEFYQRILKVIFVYKVEKELCKILKNLLNFILNLCLLSV